MSMHFKYLRYLIRHKWYVFLACIRLGLVWQGITHDLSKFLPSEWFPYARYFYDPNATRRRDLTGYYRPYDTGDLAFDVAWLHHQNRNKHHWQYWALMKDDGSIGCLPMPDQYRREMLADWRGAGQAQGYGDNTPQWYTANSDKMQLHPQTRAWIEKELWPCSA